MERKTGFEPATLALARRYSTTELLPHIFFGGGTRIRTGDQGFAVPCLSHLAMPP